MIFPGHKPRKRYGQHWLKDSSVLERIIKAGDLSESDRVLEIGPGKGALTERLLKAGVGSVHAIELDRDLIIDLRKKFQKYPNFTLQEGDAITVPLVPPVGKTPNKVIANIPYNITGPLLKRLIGDLKQSPEIPYSLLVLLLQKEVADRILASAGQTIFSALSVRIQLLAKCTSVCEVSPQCFQPPPKVLSKVILIEPKNPFQLPPKELTSNLEVLIRVAFHSRRKMLRNSLKTVIPVNSLEALAQEVGISLDQRPQELAPEIWLELAKNMTNIVDIS